MDNKFSEEKLALSQELANKIFAMVKVNCEQDVMVITAAFALMIARHLTVLSLIDKELADKSRELIMESIKTYKNFKFNDGSVVH